MKFNEWLLEKMRAKKLTQAELHRRSGISQPQISMVLSGDRGPGEDFLLKLAKGLEELPEVVFRAAGLLPSITVDETDFAEMKAIFSRLNDDERRHLLAVGWLMVDPDREAEIRQQVRNEKLAKDK